MERPRSLSAAAALVAAQGLAFTVYGVVELGRALFGHPHDKTTAVLLGITVIVLAAGIFVAAFGLLRMRRWAQSPTYLVQFFSIIIGMGQLGTLPAMMIPLVVVGLATLVAVSMPSSREALGGI
ncbi:MAG TPA: hypothetical protein VHW74_08570 [Mycobacteriales bacterium]|jgi:hypothetical protein|nr:hypothetical protein [Mycobacteriales bacterium]